MIREATPKDIEEIFELVRQVAALHSDMRKDLFLSDAITADIEKVETRIRGEKYYVLVAVDNDHVVGVIMAYIRNINNDIKYKDAKVLRIEEIVVHEEYRKLGIASELLRKMKQYAGQKQCQRIETNIWAFNDACHALLKKAGFRKQQEVAEYDMLSNFFSRQTKVYADSKTEMKRYDTGYKRIEFNNIIRHIESVVESESKILDCAAGTGNIAFELLNHTHSVVASDVSVANVKYLKKKCEDENIGMQIYHQNAMNMDKYSDNDFDVVLCMGPMYHLRIEEAGICLEECIRVVKPGGYIFISYLNKNFWAPYILEHKFPKYSLTDILMMEKKGFFDKDKGDFISSAVYYTPADMQKLILERSDVCIYKHISVDGNWGIAFESINRMTADEQKILQDYVYLQSEQPECIECGKNNMLIIKKEW